MGEPARALSAPAADDVALRTAESLRANLDRLVDATMAAIRTGIPGYARSGDEGHHRCLRSGVELALRRFLAVLENGEAEDTEWQAVFQAIGAGERRAGRTIEALHSAIRIGARFGCRSLVLFSEREGLPVRATGALTDAVWAQVDALAQACADGYAQAQADTADELGRRRRRLFAVLVAENGPGPAVIAAAAAAARWPLPRRLAAVAVDPAGGPFVPPLLTPDVLVDPDGGPTLIVPDPENASQVRLISGALRAYRAAIGPAVPPARAADSARWARRTLDLVRRGVIPSGGLTRSDDHLGLLILFQDEELLATLARRRLAPLARVRARQREALALTYLSWLQHNQNATVVADALHLHPQTVRRRLRQLELLFGDLNPDPETRFELQVALRAMRTVRPPGGRPLAPARHV